MENKSGLLTLGLVFLLVVMSITSTMLTFSTSDGDVAPVDDSPVTSAKIGFSVKEPPEPVISTGKVGLTIEKGDNS